MVLGQIYIYERTPLEKKLNSKTGHSSAFEHILPWLLSFSVKISHFDHLETLFVKIGRQTDRIPNAKLIYCALEKHGILSILWIDFVYHKVQGLGVL